MRAPDFCLGEASRLRRLARGCINASLRVELLSRAAEFEDLALSASTKQQQNETVQTRSQTPTTSWLVGVQREAAAGLSRRLRLRGTRAAGKARRRILERLCESAVAR